MDPHLYDYQVPLFAKPIEEYAPKHRLKLCMRPTPIQQFNLRRAFPSLRDDVTICIKRDDLTHVTASGNKLRKLEFLLAHALATGHDTIITAGGVQSNHARATVVAARELQLDAEVFLRCHGKPDPDHLGMDGNVFFHKMMGARIHLIPRMPYASGIRPRMEARKVVLKESHTRNAYLIGIGGSDPIGMWGYIEAFDELLQQQVASRFTHIAVATGSGGTLAGLAIANYLSKTPVKIVAFSVSDDASYFYDHVDEMVNAVGLSAEICACDLLTVVEAKGKAYGVNSTEDMRSAVNIAQNTGILLDPTYTLKAVRGMIDQLGKGDDGVFQQNASILFIHTGGLFGMFDRRIEPYVNQNLATVDNPDHQQPVN